ncbi:MAG: hypothetical protein K0R83_967 [Caulobacter sp.]|jgi:Ca-activated chloride channel family protein|nr:hypothetical protein [Caulobacter sp.]
MKTWIKALGLTMLIAATPATPVFAQDDDENNDVGELVITGSRIRQGGAQDISFFRGEAQAGRIAFPDSLTPEGLLGGYNLVLGRQDPCKQLFCLTGEAMRADLLTRPDDRAFVGLGFSSNIDGATWSREPLNLVAVVDKSGSMSGQPLALVRESLRQIIGQLRPGDQLTIVLYGDISHRYMQPTPITANNKPEVLAMIDAIASAGSTNMEAGLKVGYEAAFETAPAFKGVTRLMLFTDEQPNVGRTDADSFIGMAKTASQKDVGLTTIGVGVQFDSALATKVSSTRGGNLFFMKNSEDVKSVFEAKLDYMVSEVAHDIRVTLKPNPGYRVSAVYGVPGEALSYTEAGDVSFEVPTVFLSNEGGGLFVALARAPGAENLPDPRIPAGTPVLQAAMTYVTAHEGRSEAFGLDVAMPTEGAAPGADLALGHTLISEYLGIRAGTAAYHNGDAEGSYRVFAKLNAVLEANTDERLKPERELIGGLYKQTAMLSGNLEGVEPPKSLAILGTWEVVRADDGIDMRRGDRLALTGEQEAVITRLSSGKAVVDEPEYFEMNDKQILLSGSRIVFAFRLNDRKLTLVDSKTGTTVVLRRMVTEKVAGL